ncbi:MAG TPA: hypothetical protein VFG50_04885, partial [Rhodothermales bacterium]|nr:hypothetical protein [Rhodothermales bacterium]
AKHHAQLGQEFDVVHLKESGRGVLFASGLITGEALMGIILAIPFALAESTGVLTIPLGAGAGMIQTVIGVGAYVFFMVWLYNVARKPG